MWAATSILGVGGGLLTAAAGAGLLYGRVRRPGAPLFAGFAIAAGFAAAGVAAAPELSAVRARASVGFAVALWLPALLYLAGFALAFPAHARWARAADAAIVAGVALTGAFLLRPAAFLAPAWGARLMLGAGLVLGALAAGRAWAAARAGGPFAAEARVVAWAATGGLAYAALRALVGAAWVGVDGLALAAAGGTIVFAMVKHHVFDLDQKLKHAFSRGFVLAIFAAVFFTVDQVTQIFVSDAFGPVAGLAAALVLVIALAPIRRVTERLADRLFPEASPQAIDDRKTSVYRAAALAAFKDGAVSSSEREMLDELCRELEIPPSVASRIEREVIRAAQSG